MGAILVTTLETSYAHLRVELFEGRSAEQKRAPKGTHRACVRVSGSSADSVDVIFQDVKRENWASGGVLWSDRQAKPAGG